MIVGISTNFSLAPKIYGRNAKVGGDTGEKLFVQQIEQHHHHQNDEQKIRSIFLGMKVSYSMTFEKVSFTDMRSECKDTRKYSFKKLSPRHFDFVKSPNIPY